MSDGIERSDGPQGGRWAVAMLSLAVPVVALMVWSARSPVSAHGAPIDASSYTSLRSLMELGVSGPIAELTAMERSGADAGRIDEAMRRLHESLSEADQLTPPNWSADDRAAFNRFLGGALAVTTEWERAAPSARDLTSTLDRLGQSCTDCHATFASHLVN